MGKIFAYTSGNHAKIDQLPLQRDWMEETIDRHVYHCFPISLSNRLGWGISYPEDITFVWDGINDQYNHHVKVISGADYVNTNRGNGTISFNTDITFMGENEENVTLLTMPVPNQFIRGAQCMTTIISSSVLVSELPIAWRITEPNIEITIPANTPIAAILPISLTDIQSNTLEVFKGRPPYETQEFYQNVNKRAAFVKEKNTKGVWTHLYRDALSYLGDPFGNHEAKKIIMKVTNNAKD